MLHRRGHPEERVRLLLLRTNIERIVCNSRISIQIETPRHGEGGTGTNSESDENGDYNADDHCRRQAGNDGVRLVVGSAAAIDADIAVGAGAEFRCARAVRGINTRAVACTAVWARLWDVIHCDRAGWIGIRGAVGGGDADAERETGRVIRLQRRAPRAINARCKRRIRAALAIERL